MKLNSKPPKIEVRIILTVLFIVVLLFEAYVAYNYFYLGMFGEPEDVPEGNIVRVNLKQYEETIEHLESLYNYQPEPIQLPRANPFR